MILEILKIEDFKQLILVIFATIFIWLFKEFRKSYIDNKKESKIDIECALEKYSNLYHTVVLFQSNEIDIKWLFNSFDQAIAFLPQKITKELLEFGKCNLEVDTSKFDNLKFMIENEIVSLKDKQYSFTNRNSDESIFNQSSWFFTKYDFDALINPFMYSIFTLYGMIHVYMFSVKTSELNGYKQFAIVLLAMNSLFILIASVHILDLLLKKLVNKHVILYYILLVFAPWLLTVIFSPHISILNTITIICFFIISLKKDLLKTNK